MIKITRSSNYRILGEYLLAGIVFFKTTNLSQAVDFYTSSIGANVWLKQEDCVILKHDNFLFGFCERENEASSSWLMTFFYENQQEVDQIYEKIKSFSIKPPNYNPKYKIYHFFAKDPEGRDLEFQTFLHPINYTWKENS